MSTLTSTSPYDHPLNENIFYEMYIQDYNGDLIDIPVLIRNFQDSTGATPNSDSVTDPNQWRLVRRFFLYDTKSGIEGTNGYINGQISTVVRYPQSMTIRINLDINDDEMIFDPLLIITYRERSKTGVATNSLASVSFTAEYAMDTSHFWNTVRGLFIGCLVLFGIIVITQMCVWNWSPTLSDD